VAVDVACFERWLALLWVTLNSDDAEVRVGMLTTGVLSDELGVDGAAGVGVTVETGVSVETALTGAAGVSIGVGVTAAGDGVAASGEAVRLKFPDVLCELAAGTAAGSTPVDCELGVQRPWHSGPELDPPPICSCGVAPAAALLLAVP
jgi:hypothetical protein